MTGITIDSSTIETGVNRTQGSIRNTYPDAEAVRNAIVSSGYLGLNVSPDVKSAVNAQIGRSSFGDQFYDNLGNETSGALWNAGTDVTERLLGSQKDLALTITREAKALVAQGFTIEQAIIKAAENGQARLYVDKITGVIVRSETILSETTHIPVGKLLAGLGQVASAYGIVESLRKPIEDAYAATTGSGSAIEAEKSYIAASAGILAAGVVGGLLVAYPITAIFASAFAAAAATAATKTALDSLPQVIDVAKAAGKTLAQTYDDAAALVAEKVGDFYNAAGAAAQGLLNEAEGYINDFADGIGQLADDYGWAWDNPDAILGELPAWLPFVNGLRDGNGFLGTSPLVLDLDGDGVEASKLGWGAAGSHVYFDMDNDGFAERTAWAAGGDGLLALDRNGNSAIDNKSELFGNSGTFAHGFAALKTLDSNNDNKITSGDAQFANLRVWIDADSDAVTDAGELRTLGSLGITRIDLNAAVLSDVYNNENRVSHRAAFTINGQSRTVDDVWFRTDETDTRWTGDVALDIRTLFLPTLKGTGTLKDLHVAMSQDSALLTRVQNFAGAWNTARFADYDAVLEDVRAILYKWAGVEGMSPSDPRFPNSDAREIAFMDKLTGNTSVWIDSLLPGQILGGGQEVVLGQTFSMALHKFTAAMILQSGGSEMFESAAYNSASGETSVGSLDIPGIADRIAEALAQPDGGTREDYWDAMATFLLTVKTAHDFSAQELAALDAASLEINPYVSWMDYARNVYVSPQILHWQFTLHGTEASDLIRGGGGSDQLWGHGGDDGFYGYGGDDVIYSERGNDLIVGGIGNDSLSSYYGDDTYVYAPGDGHDIISDILGHDTIRFGTGIAASSISFDRVDDWGTLRIFVNGAAAIDVQQFFNAGGDRAIERCAFSDGATMDLSVYADVIGTDGNDTLNGLDRALLKADRVIGGNGDDTLNGGSGNDWLEGGAGDDTLNGGSGDDRLEGGYGNDTLRGHAGNDTLSGSFGSDTYIYNAGDGLDTITDNSWYGAELDTIRFGTGFTAANMSLIRISQYDMAIAFAGDQKILIEDQFSYGAIEKIAFSDGTIVDLNTWSHRVNGTSAGETLFGTDLGAGPDKLYGNGGNDMIYAYRGDDYLIGGAGDDSLDGGLGDDRYTYESGIDSIRDDGGNDRIDLGAGIAPADLTWARNGTYGLDLSINGALAVRIQSQFSGENAGIERIRFSDGSYFYLSALQFTTNGTSGDDYLYGISWGANPDDTLNGLGGNDTIYGRLGNDIINGGAGTDQLYGDAGDDTYRINAGEGADTISDSSGIDRIVFGAGFSAANLTMARDAVNTDDLYISFGGVLTVVVQSHFFHYRTDQIETLQFSDGSSVNILGTTFTQTGTANAESLYGYAGKDRLLGNGGNDTLYGYDGNDRLEGGAGNDYLQGGTGNDLYVFNPGQGTDTVYETAGEGVDTLLLGFTPGQVKSWAEGSVFYIQSASNPADRVQISGSMNPTAGSQGLDIGQRIETVTFSDGTSWNLAAGLVMDDTDEAHSIQGSSQADSIDGNGGNDTLYGYDGNDTIYGDNGSDSLNGGEGDDRLYGENADDHLSGEAGKDWMRGGAGNDTLYGGAGDDSLIGDAGVDTLYGDAGADKFIFYAASAFSGVDTLYGFLASEGDKLDVRDLLIGFDPLTKLITDFVQIADNGGSSTLKIDRDGTGGAYGLAQIAVLSSVTGLTNEQALLTSGTLLAG